MILYKIAQPSVFEIDKATTSDKLESSGACGGEVARAVLVD